MDNKILIVEDDQFLLEMYVIKLEKEGFNVLSAVDGEEGLKVAQKDIPNLILLDLNLPKMDGFQVLTELKKDENTKNIPVIVLTNYAQKDDIDKCLDLGADSYLIKAHFVPSEVIGKIKKVLNQ